MKKQINVPAIEKGASLSYYLSTFFTKLNLILTVKSEFEYLNQIGSF